MGFCCCGGRSNSDDEDDVDQEVVDSHSWPGSRPNTVLALIKCHGAYTTNYAYFSGDGPRHRLVIRVEERGRNNVKVTVEVDGREVFKYRSELEGEGEFNADGMGVSFSWDLRHSVPVFNFKSEEGYWLMVMGSRTAEDMGAIEEGEEEDEEDEEDDSD